MNTPSLPHDRHRKLRALQLGTLLSALALTASACSGSSGGSPTSPSQQPTASLVATTPPAGRDLDQLTWNLPTGEPTTLDSVKAGDYSPDTVVSNLCDPLLRLNPDFSISPNLATSYKYSPDHLTLTYTLRSGVKFWDGKPLTAADAAYSLNRNLNPKNAPVNGGFFTNVKSIVADGTSKLVVTFTKPDELFNKEMATVAGMVSEQAFTKAAGSKYGTAQGGVMCSGPFKLVKWDPGHDITLARNDDYWNPKYKAHAKSVTINFITDTNNLVQALKSGEIDGTYEVPSVALPALQSSSSGTVYEGKSLAMYEMFGTGSGSSSDPKVRQALSTVIDRAALSSAVFHGAATPSYTLIPPDAWDPTGQAIYQKAWNALPKTTSVDTKAAKALLSGDANASKTLTIALLAGDQTEINTATLIQQEAAQIGLHVKLDEMQPLPFSNAFYNASDRAGVDFILTKGYLDVADPLDYLSLVVLPKSIFNWTHYSDATVTKDVTDAVSTFDDTKRAQLITEAQARFEQAHFEVPIVSLHEVLYMNKKLTGATASFAYIYEPSLATVGAS